MKQTLNLKSTNTPQKMLIAVVLLMVSFFTCVKTFAQSVPEKVDVDINTGGGSVWYGQPWVWAIGIAIFIVIIVAITRSNKTNS